MVSYWTKLISGRHTKLCSITYRLMFHLFSTQNVNFQWLTYVKGIFDECELTYIWNSQNFINERWIKENINQCLWDQFQRNWNDDLQTCSKAINYRIFKDTFGIENYFNILDETDVFEFCNFEQLTIDYQLSVVRTGKQKV